MKTYANENIRKLRVVDTEQCTPPGNKPLPLNLSATLEENGKDLSLHLHNIVPCNLESIVFFFRNV